jgi:hypothetical protein
MATFLQIPKSAEEILDWPARRGWAQGISSLTRLNLSPILNIIQTISKTLKGTK